MLTSEVDDLRAQIRKLEKQATPSDDYKRWVSPFAMTPQDIGHSDLTTDIDLRSESSLRSWLPCLTDIERL